MGGPHLAYNMWHPFHGWVAPCQEHHVTLFHGWASLCQEHDILFMGGHHLTQNIVTSFSWVGLSLPRTLCDFLFMGMPLFAKNIDGYHFTENIMWHPFHGWASLCQEQHVTSFSWASISSPRTCDVLFMDGHHFAKSMCGILFSVVGFTLPRACMTSFWWVRITLSRTSCDFLFMGWHLCQEHATAYSWMGVNGLCQEHTVTSCSWMGIALPRT